MYRSAHVYDAALTPGSIGASAHVPLALSLNAGADRPTNASLAKSIVPAKKSALATRARVGGAISW
jgi:hypothetical protein